jgi:hypothetical protein
VLKRGFRLAKKNRNALNVPEISRSRKQTHERDFLSELVRGRDLRGSWKIACVKVGVSGVFLSISRRTALGQLEAAHPAAAMRNDRHKTEANYRRYAIVDEAMLKENAL